MSTDVPVDAIEGAEEFLDPFTKLVQDATDDPGAPLHP